jgi:prolyl-tRNA editing enzyme YbaK/EbsC (Cys-tRNA(Pro) deacylase)
MWGFQSYPNLNEDSMSKSRRRVKAALDKLGLEDTIRETAGATTAQMATDAVGCDVDKIGKSIIFLIGAIGQVVLFITAGGQQVDRRKAEAIVGETLSKADATLIRTTTGFAIGGISPVGHKTPYPIYFDETLLKYDVIWVAASTPDMFLASRLTYLHKKYHYKYLILLSNQNNVKMLNIFPKMAGVLHPSVVM